MSDANNLIQPEMTVLDVISRYRQTEAIFKRYDTLVGECVCCRALFESLRDMAGKYNLDLKTLLADLESVILPTCSEGAGKDKEKGGRWRRSWR